VGALVLLAWPAALRGDYATVAENGPASNRVNIVFLGDGYTAGEINTTYTQHINSILAHFFDQGEDPFPRYRNFFNVYRVDVVSPESGADAPPLGIYRNTALDASYYYGGGPERLLYVNEIAAWNTLDEALSGSGISPHMRLITVNDTRYGGGGGGFAVFAGGNTYGGELALHEQGHSFSNLADEYFDSSYGTYSGPEPSEVNVTKSPTGEKWSQWLGYVDSLGTVGAYEGAKYYPYGLYRATPTSKMTALNQKFNAVSREKIIQDIYNLVDPLDSFLWASGTLVDPGPLWVDIVDPNVISIEWYVNDALVPGASGAAFRLTDYGYGPGLYDVVARAFDATDWVRVGKETLEQSVDWTVELTPEPASLILLAAGAARLLLRRRKPPPFSATRS
jgi:hypothetical protein